MPLFNLIITFAYMAPVFSRNFSNTFLFISVLVPILKVKSGVNKIVFIFICYTPYGVMPESQKKAIAIKSKICYIIDIKRAIAHKGVDQLSK